MSRAGLNFRFSGAELMVTAASRQTRAKAICCGKHALSRHPRVSWNVRRPSEALSLCAMLGDDR